MKTIPLTSVGSALLLTLSANSYAQEKLNVLMIMVDDLRPQLNCYGDTDIISPNIDRLAQNGVMFSRAYCNIPVSGASRASILTSKRPGATTLFEYFARADQDFPEAVTLPMNFKRNGYRTISNSKVFHMQGDSKESWDENWRPRPKGLNTWQDYIENDNIDLFSRLKKAHFYEIGTGRMKITSMVKRP